LKPLSDDQRRNIFRLFKSLGITEDGYRRETTAAIVGKESLRELTASDGVRLIEELMRRAGEAPPESGAESQVVRVYPHRASRERRRKTDSVSAWQIEQIRLAYAAMGADLEAQRTFNTRQIKRPWPQTVGEAQTILNSLKAIRQRDPNYRMDGKKKSGDESPVKQSGDESPHSK